MKEGTGRSKDSQTRMIMRCPTLSDLPTPPRGKRGWPWTEETLQLPNAMPDGQPWPRVSIVTPSYNQGQFIEETIRSVLLQGYPDLEYIIIDGGSTDNSVEIINKYEKWLTYWVSEPDKGQSQAINKGFEEATGEIYTWISSDDCLLKDALKNVAHAYRASPKAGAWCGSSLFATADGKRIGVRQPPERLDVDTIAAWSENSFGQPACFFSKDAWQQCAPLDENLQYGMDLDLWIKIAKKFAFEKVSEVLAAERVHKDAKTQRDRGMMYAVQCQIQIRHGYEKLAMEDIRQWMNEYTALTRKLGKISRLPFLRVFRPIARTVWRKLVVS
jgi:glycosyltransferase involved in cell wall biosynthesis